jgi:RraA family protein
VSDLKPWPPGYRVNPRAVTLSAGLITAFGQVPAAIAGDCMGRAVGSIGLSAYHRDLKLIVAGPAITVRVRPGDNLMIHQAIAMAQPGDVLAVDGGGDISQALIGGLIRTSAITRGIAAFVIDGAVRDLSEWAEDGIACYARGHTPRGPSKDGPGEVNVPIGCAGMQVAPGDLVICDADGVVSIPAHEVAALLPRVKAHIAREETIRAANAAGSTDPERFNALLRSKGCPV